MCPLERCEGVGKGTAHEVTHSDIVVQRSQAHLVVCFFEVRPGLFVGAERVVVVTEDVLDDPQVHEDLSHHGIVLRTLEGFQGTAEELVSLAHVALFDSDGAKDIVDTADGLCVVGTVKELTAPAEVGGGIVPPALPG